MGNREVVPEPDYYIVPKASLDATADAIRSRTRSSSNLTFQQNGFSDEIKRLSQIGPNPRLKDVVFVDYDGEILHEYTKSEFLALTAMPDNPSHTGLKAQGWNWELTDAKEYVELWDCLCIGQNYTTSDGKTRIYVTINDQTLGYTNFLLMDTSVKGGAIIDWGDGTTQVTTANAGSLGTYSHVYASVGDYIQTIECTDGDMSLGYGGANKTFFNDTSYEGYITPFCPRKIEIGDNVNRIYQQAFSSLQNLETISIPNGVNIDPKAGGYVFHCNYKLKCIVIPKGTTDLYTNCFSKSYNLKFVSLPKTCLTFNNNVFLNTPSLRMITLPTGSSVITKLNDDTSFKLIERLVPPSGDSTLVGYICYQSMFLHKLIIPGMVSKINDYAFTSMRGMDAYHLRSAVPPTLVNTRGFSIQTPTVIYVPYSPDHSVLAAYQAATNWSTHATRMQEDTKGLVVTLKSGVTDIYDTTTPDQLRQLVDVVMYYSDGTSAIKTNYTIHNDYGGNVMAGNNSILFMCEGYSNILTFTAIANPIRPTYITDGLVRNWDGLNNTGNGHNNSATAWTDLIASDDLTINGSNITWGDNYIHFNGATTDYLESVANAVDCKGKTIEVTFIPENSNSTLVFDTSTADSPQYGKVCIYSDYSVHGNGAQSAAYKTGLTSLTEIKNISIIYNADKYAIDRLYVNALEKFAGGTNHNFAFNKTNYKMYAGINYPSCTFPFTGKIYSIRIYNRHLTLDERINNYRVDLDRIGGAT